MLAYSVGWFLVVPRIFLFVFFINEILIFIFKSHLQFSTMLADEAGDLSHSPQLKNAVVF